MGISPYLRNLRDKVGTEPLMMPGIGAVVQNDHGEILLQRASDDGKWHFIGGAMEPDEQPADAVVREVYEETGLLVRPDRLVTVYTIPRITYPNGDVIIYTAIVFACTIIGGQLQVNDDESLEVGFFAPEAMPDIDPYERMFVQQGISGVTAYFEPPRLNT
jgi:8-oxo-dGTP pyrophosphatase MutT (NUDIX family)